MQHHIDSRVFHVEIQTPKQNSKDLDRDLERFVTKYEKVMEAGYVACVTDNPMGLVSFQCTEVLQEFELSVNPEQLCIHLNTFHTKEDLDDILATAERLGVRYLLAVTGDGGGRLPKLEPADVGYDGSSVTAVQLMQYIHTRHPGVFSCGVAFNPYEPQDHELEKMDRKIEAGAEYVITQPIIGKDDRLDALKKYHVPVIVDAWMSKKLHLLSECVGYEIPEDTPYDPVENLMTLQANYPNYGLYLALLGFKTQYPHLQEWWSGRAAATV